MRVDRFLFSSGPTGERRISNRDNSGTRDRARGGARPARARPFGRGDHAAGMVSRAITAHVAGPAAEFHGRAILADPPSCSAARESADSGQRNTNGFTRWTIERAGLTAVSLTAMWSRAAGLSSSRCSQESPLFSRLTFL